MAAENKIESVEFVVNKRIDDHVEAILKKTPITLPDDKSQLVNDYIRKIEGTYDVSRSKDDTDNAIDLLYIAYNTTPQGEGNIRVGIDKLMTRLIKTQQESELQMSKAADASRDIFKSLRDLFGDWEEERDSDDSQRLKDFVGDDLFDLAEEIKGRSEEISKNLTTIAETYDGIITDTTKTTNQSEKALAARLKNQEEIQKVIDKNNADREKLEYLVKELETSIRDYNKKANDYQKQAETAEERAFIMSIVRVGAQMISAAIPAITAGITASATGGASLIASSAVSTAKQLTESNAATTEDDKTADVIEKKKDIAEKRTEKATAEREKAELEKKAKDLTAEKEKIEGDDEADAETKKTQVAAVEKRIEDNKAELEKKNAKIKAATTGLEAANAALKSLDENMGKMSEKQEEQAKGLRELQMKMLENVEKYEKEKREQGAELVKINALLKGQRTEQETIQLTIRSLNLSLKALKRMREIIVEISFFFKSFASFMQKIMNESGEQSKMIQKAVDKKKLTNSFTRRIKRNTNNFFVTQTAEWQAVELVSSKFVGNFNHGWSKLNQLAGKYLTGDELKDYLDVASGKIETFVFKRKEASTAKLADLQRYRDQIQAKG